MSTAPTEATVVNNPAKLRFELHVGDHVAFAQYMLPKGKIVFTHTEVPIGLEGQGFGSKLAHAGLQYARDNELVVIPLCPFIASFIRRHAEYQSLVMRGYRY